MAQQGSILSQQKLCGISGSKNKQMNLYELCETHVYHLFGELLLSLKDMATNYSTLAQTLCMNIC